MRKLGWYVLIFALFAIGLSIMASRAIAADNEANKKILKDAVQGAVASVALSGLVRCLIFRNTQLSKFIKIF